MESIPNTVTDVVMVALLYTISTLIILLFARYLLGTGINLEEFLIIAAILFGFNIASSFISRCELHEERSSVNCL